MRKQRRSPPVHQRGDLARFQGNVAGDILKPLGAEAGRDLRLQDRSLAFLFICVESRLQPVVALQVTGEGDGVLDCQPRP